MSAKTVEKSLVLLELLARSSEPRGVAELSRELGMPKSNVFRLLDTLTEHGYLRRRPDNSRYELTLRLWELGSLAFSQKRLVEVAEPFLDRLASETGESVHLAVFEDGESVFIHKKDGMHPVRGFTQVGSRAPAYCCATGKVALALQPPVEIERVARSLRKFTDATITSRTALQRELKDIAAVGYAVNRGEWYADVWGIASAVQTADDLVCAMIGIWAPKHRVSDITKPLGETVRATAEELSAALGCTPKRHGAVKQRRARK